MSLDKVRGYSRDKPQQSYALPVVPQLFLWTCKAGSFTNEEAAAGSTLITRSLLYGSYVTVSLQPRMHLHAMSKPSQIPVKTASDKVTFQMTLVLTTFSLMPVSCFASADSRHNRTEPGCPSTVGSPQRIYFPNKYVCKCYLLPDSCRSFQKAVFQHRSH